MEGMYLRVRSGSRYPNSKSSIIQLLFEISHSSCQAAVQFYLIHQMLTWETRWYRQTWPNGSVEQWLNGDMLCRWAHCGGFLSTFSILPFPSKPNTLTWKLCIILEHDAPPTLPTLPMVWAAVYLRQTSTEHFFFNEGKQCDVVERTVRWDLRNVVSSSDIDSSIIHFSK